MRVSIDQKGIPKINFELNEFDIQDANEIKVMLDSPGWKTLSRYLEVAKESLVDRICDGIKTKAGRDSCAVNVAVLKAFREFLAIPQRIISRAEEFVAEQERHKEEERGNESQDDAAGFVGHDGEY